MFVPLPDGFVQYFDDKEIADGLCYMWETVKESGRRSIDSFTGVLPNFTEQAKRLISSLAILDPAKRPSMSEVIVDPYWTSPTQVRFS